MKNVYTRPGSAGTALSAHGSASTQLNRRPAFLRVVFGLLAFACPLAAWAHAGHGTGGFLSGFLHTLQGLDHALAALAVGVWGVRLGNRAAWALPLAFVAAMGVGIAGAASGWTAPMTEPAIAASLLALGTLLALDARLATTVGVLVVALFAPFHAAAHVSEIPAAAGIGSFAAGLLLSTALLHAAGICVGSALRARLVLLRVAAAPVALFGLWTMFARAL